MSLAHNGVLFLDELPEFRRSTLETLRQPLEDGTVTISRAAGSMTFPADFVLVAALNPCPCGYHGDRQKECRCGFGEVLRYRNRVSGPLLDRIDIQLSVPAVSWQELSGGQTGESSEAIRVRVLKARKRQKERFGNGARCNARMRSREIRQYCEVTSEGSGLLQKAVQTMNLSARAYDRILKVARTIADLADEDAILPEHLQEAIGYRALDREVWK